MRGSVVWALLGTVGLIGCGGGGGAGGANAKTGGNGDDSIADEATKSGGIGAARLGGTTTQNGPTVASSLALQMVDPGSPVKLDGVPSEWPARFPARATVKGDGSAIGMNAALQYDEQKIFVAAEITDAAFKVGVDHAALVLAFPAGGSFVSYEIAFYPGKPGETAGSVKMKGREVAGAKIVEAPAKGGLTFEASVPWSTFAEARTTRVGLRGVVKYVDGDKNVIATGEASPPASMPPLPTEPEQSIIEGLLQAKNLPSTPKLDIFADIAGDAMKERISIYGHYLTVCGPSYRGGKEFFAKDLGADTLSLEAKNATGGAKEDLLLRRRISRPNGGTRDWFDVFTFPHDEAESAFSHEIEVTAPGGKKIANALRIGDREIDVTVDLATGWDATSYKEPIVGDADPILLPWGPVKEQIYKAQGGKFVKTKEVPNPQAVKTTPAAREALPQDVPTPPVQRTPSASELGKELLAQYKKDHGVPASVAPTTDLLVSVAEDSRPERVLVYGRDLVVLGPGFRGGTSYAYLSLSQFSSDADVKEVTARDITGDGAADVLVRGVRHVAQPSGPPVESDQLFVYRLASDGAISRIFSIETARELQGKRVQGLVQFIPAKSGKGFDILAAAGRATGYTKETFPWTEQAPGSGATEPLLLPWGSLKTARYAFDGTHYVYVP